VRATFALDQSAIARIGSTADVRLDDLVRTGWTVTRTANTITVSHPFAGMPQLSSLLAASGGVLTNPKVNGGHVSIVVDGGAFGAGVKSDSALAARLRAAGVDVNAVAAQLDRELLDDVHVTIALQGQEATVTPGARSTLSAKTTSADDGSNLAVRGGIALAIVALILMVVSFRRRRTTSGTR
jgi:hypothetical protein